MKVQNLYKLLSLFLFSFFLFEPFSLLARQMTPAGTIVGNVRVNICGDMVTDGPEHCDGTDLREQTCITFGFDKGILSCNFLCEFDISNCSYEQGTKPIEEREYYDIIEKYLSITPEPKENISDLYLLSAIKFLKYFDENNNGRIEAYELPNLVLNWVNAWKYRETKGSVGNLSCDLNSDLACNLIDFSILMSYVDRNFKLTY